MDKVAEFAMQIKREREKQGLTQAQLGEMVGVSSQTISAYEKNAFGKGKTPTLDNAITLAQKLNVSLDWLCGLEAIKPANLETVADVITHLQALSDNLPCDTHVEEVPIPTFWEDRTEIATIVTIHNEQLSDYFSKKSEVFLLYAKGTIPKGFYDSWQLGEISKLSQFPLKSKQKMQREAQETKESASELSDVGDGGGELPWEAKPNG